MLALFRQPQKVSQPKMSVEIDTLFIRHKLHTTPDILETLWQENLIAVHYLNSISTNPDDYLAEGEKTGAKVLKRLHSCIETGAIVAASFHDIHPSMIKVGRIDPKQSRIATRCFQDAQRGELIYKVVNLVSVKNVDLFQYPVLAGIQPRGATLTGWKSAAKLLEAILYDQPLPISLNSLHPSQLEILCYEYLRSEKLLAYLLAPIGRNMYDIDICGMGSNGEIILAQVTFTNKNSITQHKVRKLATFARDDRRLFYFGPRNVSILDTRVNHIPIEDVFTSTVTKNLSWIENIINPGWMRNR